MAIRSELIIAFDSRDRLWITDVKRSLETNSMSSVWFVTIERTTVAEQKEEIFVTASPSVHVKTSKHILKIGRARASWFRRKLSHLKTCEMKKKSFQTEVRNRKEQLQMKHVP